jgi:hypothetical protein
MIRSIMTILQGLLHMIMLVNAGLGVCETQSKKYTQWR